MATDASPAPAVLDLAYDRTGNGPPLVLLHPLGGSRRVWRPVTERLARERDVIAIDMPGFGESPVVAEGTLPDPAALAAAIGDFVDSLGVGMPHVAGNSLGGWVALELALAGRARTVTAVAPAGLWSGPLLPKRGVARAAARSLLPMALGLAGTEGGRRVALLGTVAHPERVPADDARQLIRDYALAPGFAEANDAMRASHFTRLADIRVPVTLGWCDGDRLVRRPRALPSTVSERVLRGCGHLPMWDDPDQVAQLLLDGSARVSGLGTVMLWSAGALVVGMVATWALATAISDVSIVDVVWGLGFIVVAWVGFAVGDGDDARRTLAVVLVTLWAGRLAGYIARRKLRERREDPRYAAMRERSDHFVALSLVKVFGLQGVLIFVVSLALQGNASSGDPLGVLDWIGVALWIVGVFFEAVGDSQLARFKADPANEGKVMDVGLWRLTRHPNYFGDFCVWWGLGLIGLSAGAWWGLVGPVIMTVLLTRVSGKDLLEKSMSKREGYAEYVERTSGFFPLPPRSAAARKT